MPVILSPPRNVASFETHREGVAAGLAANQIQDEGAKVEDLL